MSLNGSTRNEETAMTRFATPTPTPTALSTSRAAVAAVHQPDRRLRIALWRALWLGAAMVLAVPAARGDSTWLGWLPLWLVGMPACALWALHRFRLPRLPLPAAAARSQRRRQGGQARRRSVRTGHAARVRAA